MIINNLSKFSHKFQITIYIQILYIHVESHSKIHTSVFNLLIRDRMMYTFYGGNAICSYVFL
jgi:hypothetical protein